MLQVHVDCIRYSHITRPGVANVESGARESLTNADDGPATFNSGCYKEVGVDYSWSFTVGELEAHDWLQQHSASDEAAGGDSSTSEYATIKLSHPGSASKPTRPPRHYEFRGQS